MDNIEERTFLPMPDLLTTASCRKDWKRISAESSLVSSCCYYYYHYYYYYYIYYS